MKFLPIGSINMAAITFNKELYSVQSVHAAVDAFSHLADFKVIDNQTYMIVIVENCRYDEDRTVAEFGNYVIDSMNSNNGHN